MDFLLKHYDEILLAFSCNETLDGNEIHIISLNSAKCDLLPHGMQPTDSSLTHWLKHRIIPKNRAYSNILLSKVGLSPNRPLRVLTSCKGLSLIDSYWVTTPDDPKTFAQVNLYDNRFSQILSQIAFTGCGSSPLSRFRSSPEFTTNGMLPKAWRRIRGEIYLYKGGTSGFANTGKEPFSEFYAAQVAEAMGIAHIPYGLSMWKGQLCSTCKLFTSKDTAFVPASTLIEDSKITQIIAWYEAHGWREELADMLVLDAVIHNTDRHLGNFGFLVDSHTNELLRPAPIFDNGLSLYCYVMDDELDNIPQQEASLPPALYASFDEVARHVLGHRQRDALRHLLTFRFQKHSRYNLSAPRLAALEQAVQAKARTLLDG